MMMFEAKVNNQAFLDAVCANEQEALNTLYELVLNFRFSITRYTNPDDFEDVLHDAFAHLLANIRAGQVREAGALFSYVRCIVVRVAYLRLGGRVRQRKNTDLDRWDEVPLALQKAMRNARIPEMPDEVAYENQKRPLLAKALQLLSDQDRELIERFYLREQSPEVIQREMRLSPTQYRLNKSRAKLRLEAASRHYLEHGKWPGRDSLPALIKAETAPVATEPEPTKSRFVPVSDAELAAALARFQQWQRRHDARLKRRLLAA